MAQRKTLTEKQVELLRWVADGCPDGVFEGDFHRISAAALRDRNLITVSGRGPTWKARIAPAGTEYLKQIDGPNPPIPRQANVSVTQQLFDDVIAAGGSLRVPQPRWGSTKGVDYEQRARLAQLHGKVPTGKRLTAHYVGGELEIRLEDAIRGTDAPLRPVPVPQRVTHLHSVAKRFRDDTAKHLVSRAQLPRCVRIIHALVTEAERRGFTVENIGASTRCTRISSTESSETMQFGVRSARALPRKKGLMQPSAHAYPSATFCASRRIHRGGWSSALVRTSCNQPAAPYSWSDGPHSSRYACCSNVSRPSHSETGSQGTASAPSG